MAVDMFLKLAGIPGESKDHKHKEEIDIQSFSWGVSQTGGFSSGGGGGAGKANFNDLSVMKYVDKASCPLFMACSTGEHIKDGLMTVRKAGKTPLEYLKNTLTDILVSSVQYGGSSGGDMVTESLSLNFAKFKVEYMEQAADGSGKAAGNAHYSIKEIGRASCRERV